MADEVGAGPIAGRMVVRISTVMVVMGGVLP
jgi:hypothetical protein